MVCFSYTVLVALAVC